MADENTIFKGDDTGAFGLNYLTIKVKNKEHYKISKVIFSVNCGQIQKTFTDDNFFQQDETIITVNFSSEETIKLKDSNVGNLIAYDEENRQSTSKQTVTFNARNGVICNVRRNCC